MATVSISSQLTANCLPDHQVIVVGPTTKISQLDYSLVESKFGGLVSKELYEKAQEKIKESSTVGLYLNSCYLVGLPSQCSRYNTPSQAHLISKQIKSLAGGSQNLSVVLAIDYENILASVSAIARVFSLYNSKTKEMKEKTVSIEILTLEGEQALTDSDLACLFSVVGAIRNTARLVDMPPNELTTDAMVEEALQVAKELGENVRSHVVKGEDLKKLGYGGIYNVGKCSLYPPAMVVLSYTPQEATETYALVGKGIIFDTGGMQIKTKTGMPSMKVDMAGASAMLYSFGCLVQSGFNQNLHCILCIAENMIGPMASRPDDVITMLSGKTVEISNTDAEGRLVLADGVYYAYSILKASVIIDMATLTGAQKSATGTFHAAVVTNNEEWEKKVCIAGRRSGEMTHPLIFAPELHFGDLGSKVADMKNSNLGGGLKGPPSAIASLFIGSQIDFDPEVAWIHLDMCSLARIDERATGWGPALLTQLLAKDYCPEINIVKQ